MLPFQAQSADCTKIIFSLFALSSFDKPISSGAKWVIRNLRFRPIGEKWSKNTMMLNMIFANCKCFLS